MINLPILGGAPTSSPLLIGFTAAKRPYLIASNTVDQTRVWSFRLPSDYASGLAVNVICSMSSATANNVAIRIETMAVSNAAAITVDSFAAAEASADVVVPATAGNMFTVSKALINTDGATAGDYISMIIGRENGTSGINATGDLYVWSVYITYTAA